MGSRHGSGATSPLLYPLLRPRLADSPKVRVSCRNQKFEAAKLIRISLHNLANVLKWTRSHQSAHNSSIAFTSPPHEKRPALFRAGLGKGEKLRDFRLISSSYLLFSLRASATLPPLQNFCNSRATPLLGVTRNAATICSIVRGSCQDFSEGKFLCLEKFNPGGSVSVDHLFANG